MAKNEFGQADELTNQIIELIEGESPEILTEQLTLLKYHMALKAGVVDGEEKIIDVISKWCEVGEVLQY